MGGDLGLGMTNNGPLKFFGVLGALVAGFQIYQYSSSGCFLVFGSMPETCGDSAVYILIPSVLIWGSLPIIAIYKSYFKGRK